MRTVLPQRSRITPVIARLPCLQGRGFLNCSLPSALSCPYLSSRYPYIHYPSIYSSFLLELVLFIVLLILSFNIELLVLPSNIRSIVRGSVYFSSLLELALFVVLSILSSDIKLSALLSNVRSIVRGYSLQQIISQAKYILGLLLGLSSKFLFIGFLLILGSPTVIIQRYSSLKIY